MVMAPGSSPLLQSHPPTPSTDLISLKPSTGRGAESGQLLVGPASPQTPTVQTPAGSTHRPPPPGRPPGHRVTPDPELACNVMDLDIICVDDGMELATVETADQAKQPPEVVELDGSSSSETDNSSDFEDETDSEEKKEPMRKNVRVLKLQCEPLSPSAGSERHHTRQSSALTAVVMHTNKQPFRRSLSKYCLHINAAVIVTQSYIIVLGSFMLQYS